MYIQVVREYYGDKATEGKMFINGTFECHTLEDTDRGLEKGGEKVYGKTAIPKGKYNMILTYSNRFKQILPLIEDVPNYSGIRIHKGNTSANTEGCILVGNKNSSHGDDFIGSSKVAFEHLMPQLIAAKGRDEEVTIEIV